MKEILKYQYKNAFLWVPFVIAFGAALYFDLDIEPNFHFPILITCLSGLIIYKYKNIFVRIIALFLFGFFYAMSFTQIIDTPKIQDSFGFVNITGTVSDIDFTDDSTRILLSVPSNQIKSDTNKKFINLRISIKDDIHSLHIGDKVMGDAKIFHPTEKYAPSSFDFARWAYFSRISGTGFFKDYKIKSNNNTDLHLRTLIHNKAKSKLTDALVLGYKHTIPESEGQIWKSVGIGHVWSISGFHMTLVGGWLFALFYFLFRSISYITKRIPAKYPAIICAWFGLLFYLCISGISVATIRAFLMATLIFAAILLGRSVFSLRNAALAFLIIFIINPFFIMNAGFQLSFAAIFGLLWFFDNKEYIKRTRLHKFFHIIYLSFMSALIATMFTLPFTIAHFGYIPIYSLIGNIIILPIFSIIIMPLIMIGTICAIYGNLGLINLTNRIYDWSLTIAKHIADLPYANLDMPFVSNSALLLSVIGFACLVFFVKPDSKKFIIKNANYVLCICCLLGAIVICTLHQKPVFYSVTDNELVGFVVNEKLKFNKAKASKHFFAFNTWRDFNNEIQSDKNERYKCNHGLCIYKTDEWNLAYFQTFTSIMDNIKEICADKNTKFIISSFKIHAPNCHAQILNGGLLIYKNGKITKIINQRPWHKQHQQNTIPKQVR